MSMAPPQEGPAAIDRTGEVTVEARRDPR